MKRIVMAVLMFWNCELRRRVCADHLGPAAADSVEPAIPEATTSSMDRDAEPRIDQAAPLTIHHDVDVRRADVACPLRRIDRPAKRSAVRKAALASSGSSTTCSAR
jgi:hypothetical protein